MQILLGGVPFGRDNIGDDAILECVLAIFRRLAPEAEFTVCCGQPEILGPRLQVKTLPLYGFPPLFAPARFAEEVKRFDLFVWAGATGLSDYPEAALALLDAAHAGGVPTLLWNVGMDATLNPAFYRLQGRRRQLLQLASHLLPDRFNLVALAERRRVARTHRHLRRTLAHCQLVVVRDEPSARELAACGVASVIVGADSAIRLASLPLPPELATALDRSGQRLIGVCISAQRQLREWQPMIDLLNQLTAADDLFLVFIPMNPVTDRALMRQMQTALDRPERSYLVEDCIVPGVVQSIAARCDAIISSRLHLLILAGNVNTRPIGISRGSKVGNFLAEFGIAPCGTVDRCDFAALTRQLADRKADFLPLATAVHEQLNQRLLTAEEHLSRVLTALQRR